jgi:hypothetical protein
VINIKCTSCKNNVSEDSFYVCSKCYGLEKNQPGKVKDVDWIRIINPKSHKSKAKHDFDLLAAIISFSAEIENKNVIILDTDEKKLKIPITVENIDDLAKKSGILPGKWLIYVSEDKVVEVWKNIAKATVEDKLGMESKISTKINESSYVICVYTKNYLDYEDVKRVREILYEMGFVSKLSYKPDIYTYLGIYSGTTVIKPSRYYF